jgi:large subunit ribosomal protein L37Ae
MPAVTRYGSTKRFGTRYGKKLKDKIGKIEQERRLGNKCPYCHKPKVKRIAAGIWECTKCMSKFAGKAYSIGEKKIKVENIIEEPAAPEEAKEEEMEEALKEEEAA